MATGAQLLQSMAQPQPAPPTPPVPSVAPMPGEDSAPPPGFVVDKSASTPPPPGFQLDPPPKSGIKANALAGAVEGVTGTLGNIVDAVNPVNAVRGMWHDAAQAYDAAGHIVSGEPMDGRQVIAQDRAFNQSLNPTPHKLNQAVGAVTGYNPEDTTATTFTERLARGTAAGVTGSLIFPAGGEGGAVVSTVRKVATGAGTGAGSTTAAEVAPDDWKDAAGFVGGLAGGGAVGAAEPGAEVAGAWGGPKVVRQVAAGMSKNAAETEAGRVLASRATDPGTAAAALDRPGELVPGSQPTTYQQTGDPGLGSLEREVATRNQPAFQERAGQQNAARVQALGDIQQGADPNDVAKTLKAQFDELDNQTQATVDQATSRAQQRVAAMGGAGTSDAYGAALRSELDAGEQGARAREGAFWKAVDPERDLTGNVTQTIQAANDITGSMARTAKPLDGEEAGIFDAARQMQPLSQVSDLIALRSRVNDAMAQELRANGRTASYARLSQLRGAIADNLSTSIAQQVAAEDAAVAHGAMSGEDTTLARLQGWADEWRSERRAGGGVDGSNAISGGPAFAGSGGDGAGLPGSGGSPGVAGDQGLPGGNGAAQEVAGPTFDAEAARRLDQATAATKERARTYGMGPVGQVLARAGANDLFKLPEGKVPAQFFKPGPTAYAAIQQLTKSAGAKALPTLVDYAAMSLRRAAEQPDGTLDPVKFTRWRQAHTDALRALPDDVRAHFSDTAAAGQAVREAQAARVANLKDAQAGAIGKVMNLTEPQDVTRTVGAILNGRTAVADMKQLALATKGNADARAGLRQAVADYMASKLVGNTEVGTSGVTTLKGDAYQTFIKNARPALNLIFKPEEVRTMEAIAEDIQRSSRSTNSKPAGTPGTAHDVLAGIKKATSHGGKTMFDVAGALLGEHALGPAGTVAGFVGAHLLQTLHGAGVARIDQLVTQAMLNPKLAAELLKKAPQKLTPAAFRPIAAALVRSPISAQASANANGHG